MDEPDAYNGECIPKTKGKGGTKVGPSSDTKEVLIEVNTCLLYQVHKSASYISQPTHLNAYSKVH